MVVNIPIWGQNAPYKSKQYSVQDGLPGRLVLDITRDKTGLIWLATNKGLSRFDGYEFENFNNYDYSLGIEDRSFQMKMTENQSGQLVLSHGYKELSLELFNLEDLETSSIKPDLPQAPIATYTTKKGETFIVFDDHGSIKVSQLLEDLTIKEVISIEIQAEQSNRKVKLFVDQANNFWITLSDSGLFLFDKAGQLQKHFSHTDFENRQQLNSEVVFFHQDLQQRIWLTIKDEKGIFQYDPQQQFFKKIKLVEQDYFYSKIWEDEKGKLLFKASPHLQSAKMQDLLCLELDGSITSFSYLNKALRYVFSIYGKDFSEKMLAGTPTGLRVISQERQTFHQILQEEIEQGEWGMIIRGIEQDKQGNIYFGAENGGLFKMDKSTHVIDTLPLDQYKLFNPSKTYSGGRSIYFDDADNLWSLGNDSETESYLHRYNIHTQLTETTRIEDLIENYTFDGKQTFYLLQTNQHGRNARLAIHDLTTKKTTIWLDKFTKNPLKGTMTRCLSSLQDDVLWVGTIHGLIKIDLKNRAFEVIQLKDKNGKVFESQEVIAVTPIENKLWLGTNDGFMLFDIAQQSVQAAYSTEDGLVSKSVCGIIVDKNENLWLSTFYGLSHFNTATNSFQNFYEKDGITHFEFNRMAFFQDDQQKFYFGSMNGVTAFKPEDVLRDRQENNLLPTRFIKNYINVEKEQIQRSGFHKDITYTIEPNYAFFEVHFAMPNILSEDIRYSAWLENYEQDWNFLGTTPKVRYSKLPAGDYQLHVKAVDAKGNPSKNQLKLPIVIKEVFYKQNWFMALVLFLFIGMLYSIFQYNANQKLKVERLRTKLSSDLHDEVSGLLAGIAMQTDLMQLNVEKPKAKTQLQKIGETSRSAMSRMSDVIWSIDARKDKMSDLLLRMQEHAAEVLIPLDINYEFDIDTFNTSKTLGLNLRQNLYLIFTEVINNIGKHSNANFVEISLKNQGSAFLLHIKDNGTQLAQKDPKKTGQGISNLKMRSKNLKGDLTIVQDNGYEVKLKMKRFA